MTPDESAALELNNKARARHDCPPLKWSDKLAQDATKWAVHLAKIGGPLQHSTSDERPNEGENLFEMTDSSKAEAHFEAAVNAWLSEAANYHGEAIGQGDFEHYGHYTQCMWKSTTHCGLGRAEDSSGSTYIVGRYSPPGNYTGQKPY